MVAKGLFSLLPCLFVKGLYPLPRGLFVRGLSPLPCSMVVFLAAWSKSYLVASFVTNSCILRSGVLTFWGGFIRLCCDLGVFFSVAICVVFNGLLILD